MTLVTPIIPTEPDHRHANFEYLPEQQRQTKVNRRWTRVIENWARFKLKWGLPVSLPYDSFGTLSWDEPAAAPFDELRHVSAPGTTRVM
jgi:hypothetical protein